LIRSTVDVKKNLTIFAFRGQLSADELMKTVKSFYADTPTRNVVWDYSESDLSSLRLHDIQALVNVVKEIAHSREGGKSAIVAPKDASYGIGRMYQSLAEIHGEVFTTEVFRSRTEAEGWLSEK
jgi:hypothetical protein